MLFKPIWNRSKTCDTKVKTKSNKKFVSIQKNPFNHVINNGVFLLTLEFASLFKKQGKNEVVPASLVTCITRDLLHFNK